MPVCKLEVQFGWSTFFAITLHLHVLIFSIQFHRQQLQEIMSSDWNETMINNLFFTEAVTICLCLRGGINGAGK